jgi:hypothetical protein
MKRKKIIALFLISSIAFQVLPLKEMGSLLFKASLTEEIFDTSGSNEEIKDLNDSEKWETTGLMHSLQQNFENNGRITNAIRNFSFASRFIDEPPTQPPLI